MATREQVLQTAVSQLGYTESGGKDGRSGNITKYWADLRPDYQGGAWCAAFVNWCLKKNGITALLDGPTHPFYTPSMEAWAKAEGRWTDSINGKPGDVLIFTERSTIHTGFLERQHGAGSVQTVEGNGLPVGTPVLTADGWRPIGDLAVGDAMIDPQGQPSTVQGVYPQGVRPCYRLTLTDGREIIADENHRWTVRLPGRNREWIVKTTAELAASPSRWQIPRIDALPELTGATEDELGLPAWLVGAFIGDGCLTRGPVLAASDPHMIEKAYALAGAPSQVDIKDNSAHGYADGKTHHFAHLRPTLNDLGLLGHTWDEKLIPDAYLNAGVAARKELLAGLLDTDGTCDRFGRASFASGNYALVVQVQQLIRSLGGTCGITVHHPTYRHLASGEKREGSVGYRCSNIRLPFNPFTRPGKADRYRTMQQKAQVHGWGIASIEPVEPAETVCISVTAPSETYIADGWIVTHNTSAGNRGSQANGGGVYRRVRARSWVRGCIRMDGFYTLVPDPPTGVPAPLVVDGEYGPASVDALQWYLGIARDGAMDRMDVRGMQTWLGQPRTGILSTDDIKALQGKVSAQVDGEWGPNTTTGLQRWLNRRVAEAR